MTHSPTLTEADELDQMARHEITRVPAWEYRYRDYRYSKLADAIAQAKRDKRSP